MVSTTLPLRPRKGSATVTYTEPSARTEVSEAFVILYHAWPTGMGDLQENSFMVEVTVLGLVRIACVLVRRTYDVQSRLVSCLPALSFSAHRTERCYMRKVTERGPFLD